LVGDQRISGTIPKTNRVGHEKTDRRETKNKGRKELGNDSRTSWIGGKFTRTRGGPQPELYDSDAVV